MLTVPFKMHVVGEVVLEFDAEFVGLSQNPVTLSVKPEIGWLVKVGRTPVPPEKT
jgi:hypothetical protein